MNKKRKTTHTPPSCLKINNLIKDLTKLTCSSENEHSVFSSTKLIENIIKIGECTTKITQEISNHSRIINEICNYCINNEKQSDEIIIDFYQYKLNQVKVDDIQSRHVKFLLYLTNECENYYVKMEDYVKEYSMSTCPTAQVKKHKSGVKIESCFGYFEMIFLFLLNIKFFNLWYFSIYPDVLNRLVDLFEKYKNKGHKITVTCVETNKMILSKIKKIETTLSEPWFDKCILYGLKMFFGEYESESAKNWVEKVLGDKISILDMTYSNLTSALMFLIKEKHSMVYCKSLETLIYALELKISVYFLFKNVDLHDQEMKAFSSEREAQLKTLPIYKVKEIGNFFLDFKKLFINKKTIKSEDVISTNLLLKKGTVKNSKTNKQFSNGIENFRKFNSEHLSTKNTSKKFDIDIFMSIQVFVKKILTNKKEEVFANISKRISDHVLSEIIPKCLEIRAYYHQNISLKKSANVNSIFSQKRKNQVSKKNIDISLLNFETKGIDGKAFVDKMQRINEREKYFYQNILYKMKHYDVIHNLPPVSSSKLIEDFAILESFFSVISLYINKDIFESCVIDIGKVSDYEDALLKKKTDLPIIIKCLNKYDIFFYRVKMRGDLENPSMIISKKKQIYTIGPLMYCLYTWVYFMIRYIDESIINENDKLDLYLLAKDVLSN